MFERLTEIANKYYDGHYTIMHFTTEVGVCFGTPSGDTLVFSKFLAKGKTLDEAIKNAIDNKVDADSIYKAVHLQEQVDRHNDYMYSYRK